jgi:hypothetical protein
LGRLQKIEKPYELSDIERREESGSPRSEAPIERNVVARKTIERTAKDLRMAHKKEQNWIPMR